MAVNDRIDNDIREEQEGFEMIDTILDKLNEVSESSSTYSSSVTNNTITNLDFGLSVSRGVYTIRATATISDSVRGTSQTKYVDLTLR
tara:strand:+ start:1487 stop:1750 length:264 start_codon:yes stop_codon:yes gene_type:complete